MKKILIFTEYYLPGVKGGGPIQSIKNLVESLGKEIDFYIITTDRDIKDQKPYKDIKYNEWFNVGNAKVQYIDRKKIKLTEYINLINSVNYDKIFLNSFFSFKFSILILFLNKYNKITKTSLLLAPRGEFSEGALNLKKNKKKLYIFISKMFNLYKNVTWIASSENEKKDILKVFKDEKNIKIASDLTSDYSKVKYEKNILKKPGQLNIVFISRIHPMKNLIFAIQLLEKIKGNIIFDIYGPIEDLDYWKSCEIEINNLPKNIYVNYKGMLEHNSVIKTFREYHLFLLPSLGENFGHVIPEALIAGCPVIISDQTPWKNLEELGIGYDLDIKDENKFIEKIQFFVDMSNEEYQKYSKNAFNYAKNNSNINQTKDNFNVFL